MTPRWMKRWWIWSWRTTETSTLAHPRLRVLAQFRSRILYEVLENVSEATGVSPSQENRNATNADISPVRVVLCKLRCLLGISYIELARRDPYNCSNYLMHLERPTSLVNPTLFVRLLVTRAKSIFQIYFSQSFEGVNLNQREFWCQTPQSDCLISGLHSTGEYTSPFNN